MKIQHILTLLLVLTTFNLSCKTTKPTTVQEKVVFEWTILHLNDVYEIAPLEGGKVGGMARVASLRKTLEKENPNTFVLLAGDFLNPSLIGTMKYEGKRIKGRQMVEAMNSAGVDWVTFGNHEFDIKEAELQDRINESKFDWICGNVYQKQGEETRLFHRNNGDKETPLLQEKIIQIPAKQGAFQLSLGILGVCIDSNNPDYVEFTDAEAELMAGEKRLGDQVDVLIAITHLNEEEDLRIAPKLSKTKMMLGGHDHHNMYYDLGNTIVAKADANAKSAYIHRFKYDFYTKKLTIDSELQRIDETIAIDPETNKVVQKWMGIAEESFRKQGFDPNEMVAVVSDKLDGREDHIRHQPTNLGTMITKAMSAACPQADATILNSGSVRLDDFLSGEITQFDIIRTLPYGGAVLEVKMTGELLEEILTVGQQNEGSGGYLQLDNVVFQEDIGSWKIQGKDLDPEKHYQLAMTEFLLSGREKNMDFLTKDNEGVIEIITPTEQDPTRDIRLVVVDYLKKEMNNNK